MLDGQAGTARIRLQVVGELRRFSLSVVGPFITEHRWRARLEHLALDETAPAGIRLRNQLEARTDDRGKALGTHPPKRHQCGICECAPDLRQRMRIVADDPDIGHRTSSLAVRTITKNALSSWDASD